MMNRKSIENITGLIISIAVLSMCIGIKETMKLLYKSLTYINTMLLQIENTSILSLVFKYYITFPIVGIILSIIGSPKGKNGHIIGKILYFIVGYVICLILDLVSRNIF